MGKLYIPWRAANFVKKHPCFKTRYIQKTENEMKILNTASKEGGDAKIKTEIIKIGATVREKKNSKF